VLRPMVVDAPFLESQVRRDLARIHHRRGRRAFGIWQHRFLGSRHLAILSRTTYLPATIDSRDSRRVTSSSTPTVTSAGTTKDVASWASGTPSPRNTCPRSEN